MQAADHGGVDQHRERGAEAEFLDEDQLRGHERTDRDGEQERGGGHDPPGAFEADRDGLVVGDAAVIGLFDPREQEDAVVGGEPEGDREEQDRLCRVERARAPIGAI